MMNMMIDSHRNNSFPSFSLRFPCYDDVLLYQCICVAVVDKTFLYVIYKLINIVIT